jgi:hypothetical protein
MRNFVFAIHRATATPIPVSAAAPTVPAATTSRMLTRNIADSRPIFSVSGIFGLKQGGSCRSCGH